MTHRQLGELTGANHETVRRYMAGHSPSAEFLGAICSKLNVNGQWLLTGRGPMRTAEIRSHALSEARASELLSAMAATLERLQERVERIEIYVHTLEARLRGSTAAAGVRTAVLGDNHAESNNNSTGAALDPTVRRARRIAEAIAKPPRPDAG
jgi:hypothetical protein